MTTVQIILASGEIKTHTVDTESIIGGPSNQPIYFAWSDNLGADTSPMGMGTTEAKAIADLIPELNEWENEQ